MKISKLTNALLISIAAVIILIFGKKLLIPFVVALIFWFLIKEIRELLSKVKVIREKIPNIVLNLIGFISIFLIIGGAVKILSINIKQLSTSLPIYQANINLLTASIDQKFNVDVAEFIKNFLGEYDYTNLLKSLFSSLSELFSNAFLIIIYTLFLLIEEPLFPNKITAIYKNNEHKREETKSILSQIDRSIGRYLSIKTLISLITGFISYFALLFIGIDAPMFWAFLIFMMNFIPAIGSLIATVFPAIFAMLQFGDIMPGIWVLAIVGAIQLIVGNFIDPKLTGDSLNVSPLVVIIGLSVWGAIWGILGMILSVPISVMLILIFAHIPSTKAAAILLSKNGNV